jgi:hypothetical protein
MRRGDLTRILIISGDVKSALSLRRTLLRFTGSRRATRLILRRIAAARQAGRILSCMIVPSVAESEPDADDSGWNVGISYAHGPLAIPSRG